ncbi:Hypothetical predicted protein [Mytilus galloprovincialis]|uniref:Transposase Tc1-like domain-containing protein n=1 Tax=Mytilus galloprovincialis TaxID=29158 RepID=A0A8B6G3L5_MYTGA|nr:Hypothetical predicted protein [Mytilus galloprovincialis]
MLAAGMTQVQVANHLNVSRKTIARLKTRLRDTGTTHDRPRSGRPRETTLRPDRHIRIIHFRIRFVNASQTARQTHGRHTNRISAQTVRNRLRQVCLRARRPFEEPIPTQRHRMAQPQWTLNNHIRVLPWPEMSPDLSPIENLWYELGRRIRNSQNPPETWETLAQLRTALFREWNNIAQDFIRRLINSMRLRC